MNQLQIWGIPIASVVFSLLWTPLNEGIVSYGLVIVLAIALVVTMRGFQHTYQQRQEEALQLRQEMSQDIGKLIDTQKEGVDELRLSIEVLYRKWDDSTQLTETLYRELQNYKKKEENDRQQQFVQLKATIHELSDRWEQTMEDLKQDKQRFQQSFIEQYEQSREERIQYWQRLEKEHIPSVVHGIERATKQTLRAVDEVMDRQEEHSLQLKSTVEESSEELHDVIGSIDLYIEQLRSLNDILDENYLPLIDNIYQSVEALQKVATQLHLSIEEITSNKLEERQQVLQTQKTLLDQLRQ